MTMESRRNFLKATGVAVAGTTAAAVVPQQAAAQSVSLNSKAKAVLPSGKTLSRGEVLTQLGLDPGTSPDAWLAIIGCGSNASALKTDQLKGLVDRGVINRSMLDAATIKRLQ